MRSNMLKKENELSNGFSYDIVLKLRFDNIIESPINLSNYDSNFLYHQEMNNAEFEIADWINFSNSKNIDDNQIMLYGLFIAIKYKLSKSLSNVIPS